MPIHHLRPPPLRRAAWGALLSLFASSVFGCSSPKHPLAKPAAPLSLPTRLCSPDQKPPACRDPLQVEAWLRSASLSVDGSDAPPTGTQGVRLLTLSVNENGKISTFRAKWRGPDSAGPVNEPRKELAAYAVQKLFLAPDEYVAPPTAAICFREADYRAFSSDVDQPLDGADCILGFASYWLEDVKSVDGAREAHWLRDGETIWSPSLYDASLRYRTSLSQANLFMFVINHGDAHRFQFILEHFDDGGLRTYVVDNSISFRSIKNPMILLQADWAQLRVPNFPAQTLARLRSLEPADFEQLGLLDEFELIDGALVRRDHPSGAPVTAGIDWDGKLLRIGLTPGEIELVRSRITALAERTDLATF